MKLLVLDLDETLIFATEEPLEREPDFRTPHYLIYKRPGVTEFLRQVRARYHLAVWTSATASYAEAIVANLFPADLDLRFVWSRDRCTPTYDAKREEHEYTKKLSKLKRQGYRLEEVVMVDDSPTKLTRNYGNLVRIEPFLGDATDAELQLLGRYLAESLADVHNVRTVEKRNWRSLVNP